MKVAIASGKGGTGKTTLSTNLASYLAQDHAIVLTDLDVEEPNSGLFIEKTLKYEQKRSRMVPVWESSTCTLCGRCQQVCNFHAVIKLGREIMVFPELCHGCYACSELCPHNALPMQPTPMGTLTASAAGGFDFIESRLDVGQEQAVPLIAQTLAHVDEHYGDEVIKLYDCPPGTSCPVIESIKDADIVILITEPTPFGLHDLSLAVETARKLGKEFAVVINRHGIGDDGVAEYCSREGIKVLAKIPNSRKAAELYSNGELMYPHIPEIAQQLEQVSQYIMGQMNGGEA